MPREKKKSSAPTKPYSRSINRLKSLRDLQNKPIVQAKMSAKDTDISLDSSSSLNESIKSPSNKDLLTILMSMKQQQCTKTDLSKLEAAMSSKIDEVKTTAETNSSKIQTLTKRLEKFENSAIASSYNDELQKQRLLKNNICVMGIPTYKNELPMRTAAKVIEVLECEVSPSNVVSAYRTKGKYSLLVVKLANYEDKIALLNAKAKKMIKVSDVADCDPSIADNYVYVNNHVTPFFGKLLKEGQTAVKNKQLQSCWLSSSGCVVKLTEHSDPIGFNTVKELQNIINGRPSSSTGERASTKRPRKSDTDKQDERRKKQGRTDAAK